MFYKVEGDATANNGHGLLDIPDIHYIFFSVFVIVFTEFKLVLRDVDGASLKHRVAPGINADPSLGDHR